MNIHVLTPIQHSLFSFDQFSSLYLLSNNTLNNKDSITFLKSYFDPNRKVFVPKNEIKYLLLNLSTTIDQTNHSFDEMFVNMMLKALENLGFFKMEQSFDANQFNNVYNSNKPFMNYLTKWILN